MIRFVVSAGHAGTFASIVPRLQALARHPIRVWTYPELFAARRAPPGTWVFCDLERLAVWELQLAGEIARLMREAGGGTRVLNDPARAACRYELLLRLHDAGFNRFRAWRAEDGLPDARFPVFVRRESDHGLPVSALIETPEALRAEIGRLQAAGVALRGLLIIEYRAEPLRPRVFRKYAAYRIGDRILADHTVHDVTWLAKYGNPEAWRPEYYVEERNFVAGNPHAAEVLRAFEIGGIDYGRADYGIVAGEVQVWEINTNPHLPFGSLRKLPEARRAATSMARANRLAALAALDTARGGGAIILDSPVLSAYRKRQAWWRRRLVRP